MKVMGKGKLPEQPVIVKARYFTKEAALRNVTVRSVACGAAHAIAVDVLGRAFAWGATQYGQLGGTAPLRTFAPPPALGGGRPRNGNGGGGPGAVPGASSAETLLAQHRPTQLWSVSLAASLVARLHIYRAACGAHHSLVVSEAAADGAATSGGPPAAGATARRSTARGGEEALTPLLTGSGGGAAVAEPPPPPREPEAGSEVGTVPATAPMAYQPPASEPSGGAADAAAAAGGAAASADAVSEGTLGAAVVYSEGSSPNSPKVTTLPQRAS
eukprot:TRINITY_DN15219_c0_g1_i1.p2 TRINITY_DN15219_c0_g1~~TRINITY_DN15219_c0_g1_i1.p2  ORF type:complete len:283 (+),score=76.70 TRINITY_DN15219_c0_g1_i1:34-849(+)